MPKPPDNITKVVIDALEKYLKVICYLVLINASFDIIITLPPEIANRIFEAIFRKLGL